MDVTNREEIAAAVDAIIQRYGRIDVWVNNAGIYPRAAAEDVSFDVWRNTLSTNLDGTWNCCAAIIPHLRRQRAGAIINVGSIALRMGMAEVSSYLASKGGIVGVTRGLARDLGRYGIRVNCIHLGAVLVPSELRVFPDADATLRRRRYTRPVDRGSRAPSPAPLPPGRL